MQSFVIVPLVIRTWILSHIVCVYLQVIFFRKSPIWLVTSVRVPGTWWMWSKPIEPKTICFTSSNRAYRIMSRVRQRVIGVYWGWLFKQTSLQCQSLWQCDTDVIMHSYSFARWRRAARRWRRGIVELQAPTEAAGRRTKAVSRRLLDEDACCEGY